jgi:hypothetical protein
MLMTLLLRLVHSLNFSKENGNDISATSYPASRSSVGEAAVKASQPISKSQQRALHTSAARLNIGGVSAINSYRPFPRHLL